MYVAAQQPVRLVVVGVLHLLGELILVRILAELVDVILDPVEADRLLDQIVGCRIVFESFRELEKLPYGILACVLGLVVPSSYRPQSC